ncbi:MAG TPA: hypothetical protein VK473_00740 [Terriglobales bacterium]|nr:hypothetical protein [Terriglobales bacterium]
MSANAALFVFGAVQHLGLTMGPFHEPHIIPAAMVESLCALALIAGVIAIKRRSRRWGVAVTANVVAICGVVLGIIALAAGRGPRTASNDLYHRIMLTLAGASLVILFAARSALKRSQDARVKALFC